MRVFSPQGSRRLPIAVLAAALVLIAARVPADLPEKYRVWLEEVEILISKDERKAFLALEEDYQRDGFITKFWEARDPTPGTEANELREEWRARLDFVRDRWGDVDDDRSRVLLLNGEPDRIDERHLCPKLFHPTNLWYYDGIDNYSPGFGLIFYQRLHNKPFHLWYPSGGIHALLSVSDSDFWRYCPRARALFFSNPRNNDTFESKLEDQVYCFREQVDERCTEGDAEALREIIEFAREGKGLQYLTAAGRAEARTPARDEEWLRSFAERLAKPSADAARFDARLEILYPGRRGQRTVVQGVLSVDPADATTAELAGARSYNFLLTGEVLRQGELFESFRYRFDFAAAEAEAADGDGAARPLAMSFQRLLRPGEFELVLKLEDVHAGSVFHERRALAVPRLEEAAPEPVVSDPETARLLAEAAAAIDDRRGRIELVAPEGDVLAGMIRFDAVAHRLEAARVKFFLDGELMLSKRRPPYSVELDLGQVPRPHIVEAVAYDDDGGELARDALELNAGSSRFAVRLVEPRRGAPYRRSLLARAEVEVPDAETLERVEIYLDERRVATLYQPPWEQTVLLDGSGELSFVRAVAFLEGGYSTEDVAFVNAPRQLEEVEVSLVELYVAATDSAGRPVLDLEAGDFTVLEDGVEQQVLRFEKVSDLPIHAGILFDASSSMDEHLEPARRAAVEFFERVITPKDRAAVITFSDRPALVAAFTHRIDEVATQLTGVRAEGSTALWDSVVFALHYFSGLRGQRAVLLLTDGRDESSRFSFDEALAYAQTQAVSFYTVGLGLGKIAFDRPRLMRLADATGGRSYFIRDATELGAIYAEIEAELRSKYFLTYQSSNPGGEEFRRVEVRAGRSGVEVKARPGYFP